MACQDLHAQTQTDRSTTQLEDVTVKAGSSSRSGVGAPAAQFSGSGLVLKGSSSLGEMLNGEPGISSTYFGPVASRPVVRGMDGDRLRILNNGADNLDVSGLSYDHAVAIDPLVVERLEIFRGPAAMRYGGNGLGGAVNMVDGRIPREAIKGLQGRADLSLNSGDRARNAAVILESGNEKVSFHVDAYARKSGDMAVPVSLPCQASGSLVSVARLCNSAASSRGGAVGASVFFPRGYLGFSVSTHEATYGSVAEDEVSLSMQMQRAAVEGKIDLEGWVSSLKAQVSFSDYKHTEFDAGVAGTVFANKGNDVRLEARHRKLGNFEGLIGFQMGSNRFSADGLEAFAPNSRTRQQALFVVEEAVYSWGKLNVAGRIEHLEVTSLGNPQVARFGTGSQAFAPASFGFGGELILNSRWTARSSLTMNQRAPRDYELYADGPHLATAAYEVGDARLGKESSRHLEVGLAWRGVDPAGKRTHSANLNLFVSRFSNFLTLNKTGNLRGADGEVNPLDADGDGVADLSGESILPEFKYQQQAARFHGFEANGTWRVPFAGQTAQALDLQWRLDYVHGRNSDTGALLPRIAPLRAGATLVWSEFANRRRGWSARLGFDHFAQAADRSTPAYTFVNAGVSYETNARIGSQDTRLLWYARLDNMSDRLAYSATSVLTQSLPGRVPLPGRSLRIGVQALF